MTPNLRVTCLLSLLFASAAALAQHEHAAQASHSPYAGMQTRAIKSLSDADIEELHRGGGWGLALPAELNGMPGPAHVLELKDELPLSAPQTDAVQRLFEAMRAQAIAAGKRLIEAEAAIEQAFASRKVDHDSLRGLLGEAESARTELRFIHLSRHYETAALLRPEQIARYNVLRGYADDPCDAAPEGHDPVMYRRHMGCR